MILARRVVVIDAPFCGDCGVSHVREMTGTTLLTGWWGIFSFFNNLIIVATNLSIGLQYKRMPRPNPASAVRPPHSIQASPLFRFEKAAFLALLVLIFVAYWAW